MVSLAGVLLAVHVLANVVWIGALLSVSLLVARAAEGAADGSLGAAPVGKLARGVHLSLAAPAFTVSFLAGLALILMAPRAYAHLPWFHAKLTFALIVVVLHHVIGARARKLAGGDPAAAKGVGRLGAIVLACVAITVFLAVLKPMLGS